MRSFLAISSLLLLVSAPGAAFAQDDTGAPAEPVAAAADEAPATAPTEEADDGPGFSSFVGVGVGTNINGGTFGYELEASVGIRYGVASIEMVAGTMSLHGGTSEITGPHFGVIARVIFVENEDGLGFQGGLGLRSHHWAVSGASDNAVGLVGALRLYLPLTDFAMVRIDGEYERLFDTAIPGDERNIYSLGFGLETRFDL